MRLYEVLNIPSSCRIERPIFKKLFYEHASLCTSDKKLFTDNISKITSKYCINPETSNIAIYQNEERDYLEIEVIEVELYSEKGLRRIAEIIMRAIPYPMLLIFLTQNRFQIWTAHSRINLADPSKLALEDFIYTDWISFEEELPINWNIRNMRFTNYYALYSDMVNAIILYNANRKINNIDNIADSDAYPNCIASTITDVEKAKKLLMEIEALENEIAKYRTELKKETQFNRQMDLNIRIKGLEQSKIKCKRI